MIKINDLTLKEYLSKNNVVVLDDYFKTSEVLKESKVIKQINLIREIDDILTKYTTDGFIKINSIVGKKVEIGRVYIKKLKIDLAKREKYEGLNSCDIFLLENGHKILKRAEETIDLIKEIDFLGLIKRSMNRGEICIGRGDEGNLRYGENIEVGKLKSVRYNLIEEDIFEYLKRIYRKGNVVNLDKNIDKFILNANLNRDSKEYIKILLKIPYDALKQWYRYSEGRREVSAETYLNNIKESLKYEINIIKGED